MIPTLLVVLSLAVIDSINPSSITVAAYLAGSRPPAQLRRFIVAVYVTYLAFGMALVFGPARLLRSWLSHTSTVIAPVVEIAVGGLLVSVGLGMWRRLSAGREPVASTQRWRRGSAHYLGVLTTVADLPTAGPLFVASAVIAATKATAPAQISDLLLYNVVYVAPLVAVGLTRGRLAGPLSARLAARQSSRTWASSAAVMACVAAGTAIGCLGVLGLVAMVH